MPKKTVTLSDLAAELLHQIFESLADEQDLRALRLTSKNVEAVASFYALRRVHVYTQYQDFSMLRHFAEHPILSSHVREIIYYIDALEGKAGQRYSWSDFLIAIQDDTIMKARIKRSCPLLKTSRAVLSQSESWSIWYDQYTYNKKSQNAIIENGHDIVLFRDTIPKFRRLEGIMVSGDDCGNYCGIDQRSWAEDSLSDGFKPFGIRELSPIIQPLLNLLSHSIDSPFRHLRLGYVHWSVLASPVFHGLSETCGQLTTFQLALHEGVDNESSPSEEISIALEKGPLRKILSSMPKLEVLSLDFERCASLRYIGRWSAKLSDLIPANACWEHLTVLKLNRVAAPRQVLESLIWSHRGTLEVLHLSNVHFLRSSWLLFVEALRHLATAMKMETFLVTGQVLGVNESTGQDEHVNFSNVGGKKAAETITRYILRGER